MTTANEQEDWKCPKCGIDRKALRELLNSTNRADRTVAWIAIENCVECKRAMEDKNGDNPN